MKTRSLKEGSSRCKSKLHKEVYNNIKETCPSYRIYNEYTYNRIIGDGQGIDSRLRADIFIKDIDTVVEVMGEQHYSPVAFGGDKDLAERNFNQQLMRDRKKRGYANLHEFSLIEFPHYISLPSKLEWLRLLMLARTSTGFCFRVIEDNGELKLIEINEEGDDVK